VKTTMTETLLPKPRKKTGRRAACTASLFIILIVFVVSMNHALVIWHLPGHSMEAGGQFQRGGLAKADQPCPLQPDCPQVAVDCGAKPGRPFDIIQHRGQGPNKQHGGDVKKKSRSLVLGMAVRQRLGCMSRRLAWACDLLVLCLFFVIHGRVW
jgi:hypothetical protein